MNPAEFANIAQSERTFWWYRGTRAILNRLLDAHVGGRPIRRVLEAGCGTGHLSQLLQMERGWWIVPVDISAEGLRYAQNMGLDRAVQADITSLPFASRAFDLVLSMDVLVHMPPGDERLAMAELARVLSPGGLLAMRVAAFNCLRSRHSEFVGERQRYTRGQLAGLARSAGLRVLRSTYANSLLVPVAWTKFRIWEPLTRKPPASGVAPVPTWLDRMLYAPLAAEARWIAAGHSLPIGQSVMLLAEKSD